LRPGDIRHTISFDRQQENRVKSDACGVAVLLCRLTCRMIRPNHDLMVETDRCQKNISGMGFAFMPFVADC
jgi:hypothetical protein